MVKVTIPGRKRAFRLYGKNKKPMLDIMIMADEAPPTVGVRIVCRDPFHAPARVSAIPSQVEEIHQTVFETGQTLHMPTLSTSREYVKEQLGGLPPAITRYEYPEPYRVKVSERLFRFLHELWEQEAPMEEMR
jgi:nicotinate phosphoribosyltransferase